MKNKYLESAIKLNNILKKGDITLIDEFENEFIKFEHKLETTAMIVFGNRNVVRKGYYIIVKLYGSDASLYDLKKLLDNYNEEGNKMCIQLTRVSGPEKEVKKNNEISHWMICSYLCSSYRGKLADNYVYAAPTRYILDKLIDTCENNNYSLLQNCFYSEEPEKIEEEETEESYGLEQSQDDMELSSGLDVNHLNKLFEDAEIGMNIDPEQGELDTGKSSVIVEIYEEPVLEEDIGIYDDCDDDLFI